MSSYRTLLVVDAEGFSRNRDVELPGLHTEIRRVVACACERSGLGAAWEAVRFMQSTGDGVLAVLPLNTARALIHPFTDHLQDALAEAAPQLRARGVRLRLRVALHTGLVDDKDPITAGISTATIDVNRLLDCEPLRAALRDSDPDLTFAALIVSSETYGMFVRGGFTGLAPSQFTPVSAKVKQFDQPAYLYVPKPSQGERPPEASAPDASPPAPIAAPGGGMSFGNVTVSGDAAQSVIGSQGGQGIRQARS